MLLLALVACGGDNNDQGNSPLGEEAYVDWASLPSEYNPEIEERLFSTTDLKRVSFDVFNFVEDVEVVRSDELYSDEVKLELYRISDGFATWGRFQQTLVDDELSVSKLGSYNCSIEVVNQVVNYLEGGCYIKMVVVLPIEPLVEVYVSGVLSSPRLYTVAFNELLQNMDDSLSVESMFFYIEDFVLSYQEKGTVLDLTAYELELVGKSFTWADQRLRILETLHPYVNNSYELRQTEHKKQKQAFLKIFYIFSPLKSFKKYAFEHF